MVPSSSAPSPQATPVSPSPTYHAYRRSSSSTSPASSPLTPSAASAWHIERARRLRSSRIIMGSTLQTLRRESRDASNKQATKKAEARERSKSMQIDGDTKKTITSPRLTLPHPMSTTVDVIHSPLHTACKSSISISSSSSSSTPTPLLSSSTSAPGSPHGAYAGSYPSPLLVGSMPAVSPTHAAAYIETVPHPHTANGHQHSTMAHQTSLPPHHPTTTLPHSAAPSPRSYSTPAAAASSSHSSHLSSPSSPIASASPAAKRIKSHFAAQGRDLNSYALPDGVDQPASSYTIPTHNHTHTHTHTRTETTPHTHAHPHTPSQHRSPAAGASHIYPPPPLLTLPTQALHLPSNTHSPSHAPQSQSEEQEAILFSPAYMLPHDSATAAVPVGSLLSAVSHPAHSGHPHPHSHSHPLVAVNSIHETVVAQSSVVQTAVVAAAAHSTVAENDAVREASAAAAAASAAAVAANGVTEDEFDPFLFIKNLPPLAQAIRSCTVPVLPPLIIPSSNLSTADLMVSNSHDSISMSPSPSPSPSPILTLALDLDETLVHCSIEPMKKYDLTFSVYFNGQEYSVYVALRPHLFEFLDAITSMEGFEVVIFTASQKIYADKLLGILDPPSPSTGKGKYFHHRIFRDSCVCVEGNYLKDLSVLGRDLRTTVIVDNSVQAFGYQLDNGIPIESWFDDQNDKELLKLLPFLKHLRGMKDVRPILKHTFKLSEFVHNL